MIHESPNEKDSEIKKVMCWASPGCHDNCRLEVTVQNGRVEKLSGNRNFPKHRMQGCGGRMPYLKDWLYHPEQLMHPL